MIAELNILLRDSYLAVHDGIVFINAVHVFPPAGLYSMRESIVASSYMIRCKIRCKIRDLLLVQRLRHPNSKVIIHEMGTLAKQCATPVISYMSGLTSITVTVAAAAGANPALRSSEPLHGQSMGALISMVRITESAKKMTDEVDRLSLMVSNLDTRMSALDSNISKLIEITEKLITIVSKDNPDASGLSFVVKSSARRARQRLRLGGQRTRPSGSSSEEGQLRGTAPATAFAPPCRPSFLPVL